MPNSPANSARLPTLFIPHGGGPCFFMDMPPGVPPDTWARMAQYLRSINDSLPTRPNSILVISAHWEMPRPTVTANAAPALIYDYHGFPPHTYELTYPAPGSPQLAMRVQALLNNAGIASSSDATRGFDHGVFIPFKLVFPNADIPIVQLSLLSGLDPKTHLQLGAALAPLRDEGVLIVGSGMSYHNLGEFMRMGAQSESDADDFDRWLTHAVEQEPSKTSQLLSEWQAAPDALRCHPRAEHLLPLMVVAGAANGDRGECVYKDRVFGKTVSGFQFG